MCWNSSWLVPVRTMPRLLAFAGVAAWSVPPLAAATCDSHQDCGSCVNSTTLYTHMCYWCEIDSQCHTVGNTESPCSPSEEDGLCITLSDYSTCTKKDYRYCQAAKADSLRPQQIHLALAGDRGMRVAFKTWAKPSSAAVVFSSASGKSGRVLIDRTSLYWEDAGFYHSATLKGLDQGVSYQYHVSVDGVTSEPRTFRVPAADLKEATFLVVGDMGYGERGNAIASRKRLEALKGSADVWLHAGDIGYADDAFAHVDECFVEFCYEGVYDKYMNGIENITDTIPYMVAPGNHESECHSPTCITRPSIRHSLSNFSAYNARFTMPALESGGVLNMWYSFDYASAHIVVVNTETDFSNAAEENHGDSGSIIGLPAGHFAADGAYLRWLEADLKAADANRERRPWVIAMGHRPWNFANPGRSSTSAEAEAHAGLFKKYNVDLFLSGHEHNYQRAFPLGNNTATPTIITGGAGCDEFKLGTDDKSGKDDQWDWHFFSADTQVGLMKVTASELTWSAIASSTGRVLDDVTLRKAPVVVQV